MKPGYPHSVGVAAALVDRPVFDPLALSQHFKDVAQSHALWAHPFVQGCRAGRITPAHVRALGGQMYKFCREFTRFLAAAMAHCPDEATLGVLGHNLWEELGEGDPARAHPALFRRFTRALGLSDAELAAIPAEPETQALIDTYLGLGRQFGLVGALGAICYASEGIVGALYGHIRKGLFQAIQFPEGSLEFFDVHVLVDDGHADQIESVLLPLLRTEADVHTVEKALVLAMDARCRFFDAVLRVATRQADPLPQA